MICDTSGLLAAFAADQPRHEECVEALLSTDDRLVSPVVLTEVDYLAGRRLGQKAAADIMKALSGPEYRILSYSSDILATAAQVMATYADLNLGVVDASLVAHSKLERTHDILTLDQRHFRVVRALDGRPFRLFPFDADDSPSDTMKE